VVTLRKGRPQLFQKRRTLRVMDFAHDQPVIKRAGKSEHRLQHHAALQVVIRQQVGPGVELDCDRRDAVQAL